MPFFKYAFLPFLVLSLASCSFTTGEGPVVEKEMRVASFDRVEVEGSFDVVVNQETTQSILAVGQENIIGKLQLDVVDNTLFVSLEPGNYLNYDLEVRIFVPTVKSVSLNGSGNIELGTFVKLNGLELKLEGSGDIETTDKSVLEVIGDVDVELDGSGDVDVKLKANNVRVNLDGSGDVDLVGTAQRLEAKLDGSGDIDCMKLEAAEANVELDGSGNIDVHAKRKLKADLNGSGDIRYKGEPKVEVSIDGSGSITAK